MAMELRHLRYFIAVAEEGHITRAAERLGMQQPPLSRQIKAIERELGVQLFHRKARGVDLTAAGRAFLEDAHALFAHLARSVETTRSTARGEQGQISVGVTPTAPFHPFVPRVVRAFGEAFPLVSLTVDEFLTSELIDRLRDERIDVAFIRNFVADADGLNVIRLIEEPMSVALPSGHPLVRRDKGKGLAFKCLAGEKFILYGPPGAAMYDRTIAACDAAGFSPIIGQQVARITSSLSLVAAGLGISIVPSSMQRLTMEGVAFRRLRGAVQPKAILNLASRRGDPSAVVRHFVTLVRRTARDFRDADGG